MKMQFFNNNLQVIEDLYDRTQKWYMIFYTDRDSLSLHYGFWNERTRSKKEALVNQYDEVSALLKPDPGDVILDAGCGVGGASIWLAEKTGATLHGITLSSVQVKDANKYADARGVGHKTSFHLGNYFQTDFEDNTFDKAFAIESFCYSYPEPERFFQEIFRILKPGGRIVVSDAFLLRTLQNEEELKLARDFCQGVKMNGWSTKEEIIQALEKSGFSNIRMVDKTSEVEKSVKDVYRLGVLALPVFYLLKPFGLTSKVETDHYLFARSQRDLYRQKLVGYGLFYGEKA